MGAFYIIFYFHLNWGFTTELREIKREGVKRELMHEKMRVGGCGTENKKNMRGGRYQQVLAVESQHDIALDAFLTLS